MEELVVKIELCLQGEKGDENDDVIKECIYSYLLDLIEDDSLYYEVQ